MNTNMITITRMNTPTVMLTIIIITIITTMKVTTTTIPTTMDRGRLTPTPPA